MNLTPPWNCLKLLALESREWGESRDVIPKQNFNILMMRIYDQKNLFNFLNT